MKGHADIGTANRISGEWTIGQRIEAGEAVRSLLEHPGWALVMDLVEDARSDGMEILISSGPLEQAVYARRLGGLSGMSFTVDVAAAVIESADLAIRDARKDAALEAAAEGS